MENIVQSISNSIFHFPSPSPRLPVGIFVNIVVVGFKLNCEGVDAFENKELFASN